MKTLNPDTLSSFARVALKLDHDFSEIERIGTQLSRLEIDSESGMERGLKLLAQFQEHGESIASGIQDFAVAVDQARKKAEASAALVAERALLIQARRERDGELQKKLSQLGARVQEANAGLLRFRDANDVKGDEGRCKTHEILKQIDVQFVDFAEEAKAIQLEAAEARVKSVEKSAQSLYGTLHSARRKLSELGLS